jgi:hypothetical protein
MLLGVVYRPILDPLPLHGWEWAVLPAVALLMAMAYKGVRCEKMGRYWRDTFVMTGGIVAGLIALSAGAWALIEMMRLSAPA